MADLYQVQFIQPYFNHAHIRHLQVLHRLPHGLLGEFHVEERRRWTLERGEHMSRRSVAD